MNDKKTNKTVMSNPSIEGIMLCAIKLDAKEK